MDRQLHPDVDFLKGRIRDFMKVERWTTNRLAVTAGLRASTLQEISNPNWNPRADTLQACMEVVNQHSPVVKATPRDPVANPLPVSFLAKRSNREFQACIELWKSVDMRLSDELFNRLSKLPIEGGNVNGVVVGDDNRMRVARFESGVFGSEFFAEQLLLSDMPDQKLFNWIESRMWQVVSSEQPTFSACAATVQSDALGLHDFAYTVLALPCITEDEGVFDAVVTVNRLEPSPYTDRVSRIRRDRHAA